MKLLAICVACFVLCLACSYGAAVLSGVSLHNVELALLVIGASGFGIGGFTALMWLFL